MNLGILCSIGHQGPWFKVHQNYSCGIVARQSLWSNSQWGFRWWYLISLFYKYHHVEASPSRASIGAKERMGWIHHGPLIYLGNKCPLNKPKEHEIEYHSILNHRRFDDITHSVYNNEFKHRNIKIISLWFIITLL